MFCDFCQEVTFKFTPAHPWPTPASRYAKQFSVTTYVDCPLPGLTGLTFDIGGCSESAAYRVVQLTKQQLTLNIDQNGRPELQSTQGIPRNHRGGDASGVRTE